MKYDVFISYSRKDSAIVKRFADELGKAGYRYWMDVRNKDEDVTDEYQAEICYAIKNSDVFMLFSSESFNSGFWTIQEVYLAVEMQKKIIPIKLDNADFDERIRLGLAGRDFIQVNKNLTESVSKILVKLDRMIGLRSVPNRQDRFTPFIKIFAKVILCVGFVIFVGIAVVFLIDFLKHIDKHKPYSREWYSLKDSAEQGYSDAQFKLAVSYANGESPYGDKVGTDWYTASLYFEEAAFQGHKDAIFNLGLCYAKGNGYCGQSWEKAASLFEVAANQGHAQAQRWLGDCYANGHLGDTLWLEAARWYEEAAKQGDKYAQYSLGNCYYNGIGKSFSSENAFEWYEKAAEQDYDVAQWMLGNCYQRSIGVSESPEEAFKWFEKAAKQGQANAILDLGQCYFRGYGCEKSLEDAVTCFYDAACCDMAKAQLFLAFCMEFSLGTSGVEGDAIKWYRKAAEQGLEIAKERLEYYKQETLGEMSSEPEEMSAAVGNMSAEEIWEADGINRIRSSESIDIYDAMALLYVTIF